MWSKEEKEIRAFLESWPSSINWNDDQREIMDNNGQMESVEASALVVTRRNNNNAIGFYKLKLEDVKNEVFDWIYSILEEKKCPYSLTVTIAKLLSQKISDEMSQRHQNGESVNDLLSPIRSDDLYQEVTTKLDELCMSAKSDPEELIKLSQEHSSPSFLSSVAAVKNGRRKMEDRHVILHNLNSLFGIKSNKQYSYYAVFDGHAGVDAATYTASHLHLHLINSDSFKEGDIKSAIKEAFSRTDLYYLERSAREGIKSGSTAVCCLLEGREKLFLAWLGDSQAILVKNGKPHDVMNPHKPEREDERNRIEEMGGMVSCIDTWRVNGTLAVSRAIGDPEHKPYVSSDPDIEEIELDGTEDFLIVACDGLWDQITPEEATGIVYQHLAENCNTDSNRTEMAQKVSNVLIESAKREGSTDNITVIVVFLRDIEQILKTPFTPLSPKDTNCFNNFTDFNENSNLYTNPFAPSAPHLGRTTDFLAGSVSDDKGSAAFDEDEAILRNNNLMNLMEAPTPPADDGSTCMMPCSPSTDFSSAHEVLPSNHGFIAEDHIKDGVEPLLEFSQVSSVETEDQFNNENFFGSTNEIHSVTWAVDDPTPSLNTISEEPTMMNFDQENGLPTANDVTNEELNDVEDRIKLQNISEQSASYVDHDRVNMIGNGDDADEVNAAGVQEPEKVAAETPIVIATKEEVLQNPLESGNKLWAETENWGRDLFNKDEQQPKLREEGLDANICETVQEPFEPVVIHEPPVISSDLIQSQSANAISSAADCDKQANFEFEIEGPVCDENRVFEIDTAPHVNTNDVAAAVATEFSIDAIVSQMPVFEKLGSKEEMNPFAPLVVAETEETENSAAKSCGADPVTATVESLDDIEKTTDTLASNVGENNVTADLGEDEAMLCHPPANDESNVMMPPSLSTNFSSTNEVSPSSVESKKEMSPPKEPPATPVEAETEETEKSAAKLPVADSKSAAAKSSSSLTKAKQNKPTMGTSKSASRLSAGTRVTSTASSGTTTKTATARRSMTTFTVTKTEAAQCKSPAVLTAKKPAATSRVSTGLAPRSASTRPAPSKPIAPLKATTAPSTNGTKPAEKKVELPKAPKINLSNVTSKINSRPTSRTLTSTATKSSETKPSPKSTVPAQITAKPTAQVNGSNKPTGSAAGATSSSTSRLVTKKPLSKTEPSKLSSAPSRASKGHTSVAPPAARVPLKRSTVSTSALGTRPSTGLSTRSTATTSTTSASIKRRSTASITQSTSTTKTTVSSSVSTNTMKTSKDLKSTVSESKLIKRGKNSVDPQNSLKSELEAALEKESPNGNEFKEITEESPSNGLSGNQNGTEPVELARAE